jgi:metal-dependent hydrolase (beta-lactamase superfamily II)
MAISVNELRTASYRSRVPAAKSLYEAKSKGLQTVFLSHSHNDEQLVKGLVILLEENGWHVYVDWADAAMPETPNRQTAERIKKKIVDMNYFLFLATDNSMTSRWCPWEIGYADGTKNIEKILVVPTSDGNRTHGNEYIQLYRRIELSNLGKLAVWQPGQTSNGVLLGNLWREG